MGSATGMERLGQKYFALSTVVLRGSSQWWIKEFVDPDNWQLSPDRQEVLDAPRAVARYFIWCHSSRRSTSSLPVEKHMNRLEQECSNEAIFLRLPAVKALTGLSKSSLYALIRANSFPAPVRLGPRTAAWVQSEIRAMGRRARSLSKICSFRSEQQAQTATCSPGNLGSIQEMGLSRQRFPALGKLRIQIICPPLHHRCALPQILRVIVGSSHFVALHVGELQFDMRLLEVRSHARSSMPVRGIHVPSCGPDSQADRARTEIVLLLMGFFLSLARGTPACHCQSAT